MEDLLQRMAAEGQRSSAHEVVRHSHEALELLCDKMSLMRSPMNEVRDKCCQAFRSGLSAPDANHKLSQLSIAGLKLMLRQDMYWTVDSDEYEHQLPSQLIDCIRATIGFNSETTQLDLLSILSELSFSTSSLITLDTIEDIIEICCQLKIQSVKHRQAVETTAGQSCHHFFKHCLTEVSGQTDADGEDMTQLVKYIVEQLARSQSDDTIGVLLKCLHYSLLTIPIGSPVIDIVFHDIVWQTMIPTLIKILSPIDISHQKSGHDSSQDFGRGSECVTQMHISDHKTVVFKIAAELLRLLAEISSLRPSIESLFHRLLLCPPVSQRLDAIKWLEEILKNVNLLVGASVEPLDRFGKSSLSKDLDLLHIVMDSLEECSLSNDSQTALQAIASMVTFLRSLQIICGSEILEPTVVHRINSMYPNLADADFEGFEVRQSTRTVVKPEQSSVPQRRVSLTTLKERIVGFNEQQQMNQTAAEEEAEQKAKKEESDRNLRNYKVEAYKSKLKEIMDSRSTDSYNESTDVETHDNVNTSGGQSVTEKRDMDDMDDHWTARESDSSLTEGPAYEDCVEQIADKEEYHSFAEILHNDSEGVHCERNNARRFITSLKAFLPELLSLRTCVEADQAMQTFASNYCTGLLEWQKSNRKPNPDHSQPAVGSGGHMTIVNADGIYLSTYSTLLLNLKLIQTNFYDNSSSVPMTEREFIEDIQNCGILVYISRYWLAELYQRVLADNLLVNAGYDPSLDANVALVNLLIDLDGLNNCQPGGQQLCDYRRLEKTMTSVSHQSTDEVKAAHKLVRRLITAFWETAIGCLGIAFKADSNTQLIGSAFSSLIGRDGKDNSRREMIILSLEGLQICAKLCIQLGLQSKCDKIFELLSLSVDEADVHTKAEIFGHKNRPIGRSILEVIRSRGTTGLHTSSVMSLQVLLSCSLEVGSHCPVCWRYVFKCCQHIMELEHCYFTSRHASILSSTRTSIVSLMRPSNKHSSDYEEFNTTIDSISMPGINEAQEIDSLSTIDSLISESIDNASDSVLKDKPFERVIGILSHLVDFLFEDAANKLNLRCLQSFVTELCLCSAEQLSLLEKSDTTSYSPKSLLLFRLSDVMLRCAKSGRPLLHFMKCWSIVASHLVEAVSHSDHTVAKKSVSTLHDIINAMLYSHNELPHFHFNEALFKPFECLLLQELCDLDIQELIISSICEFVEGTTEEIRSGWRSLFGALRGIRFTDSATLKQSERSGQLRIILDIFEAFLHTDNLQVFANASVDCLLCLLKLIKSPNNSSTDSAEETSELCMISLRYLDQLMSMLRSMYRMPGCPVFSNIRLSNSCVNTKFIDIARLPDSDSVELKSEITLKELDRSVQILQVCFLLVDEFAETLDKCHPKHRNTAVDMLFNWLKSFMESIDPRFGVYCINHILLPSLQRITRQTLESGSETSLLSTLRHMFGSTADLLVTYFELADKTVDKHLPGLQLMLTQTLLVYIECLNGDYKESIAKLSCACIRHILLSVRTHIDNNLWQTTIQCLSIAHKITLQSLETLVNAFNAKSQQFFDDLDQIQVLSRRDPNEDSEQLCRLAQQIFLLDIQKSQIRVRTSSSEHRYSSSGQYGWTAIAENRSFVFLIKSKDNNYLPVSFRVLIVQLTCHWLLLQTICSLSLCGIDPVMANVKVFMDLSASDAKPSLVVMDSTRRSNLISLLDSSYRIAMNFDSKPGLKFLIQKISRCEMPSNLYRFSSLVWSVRVVIDVFLISQSVSEAEDDLKHCLTDLTDRYCQLIRTTETTEPSIDKISHQSLHFLQASNEELMNIIGRRDLKTGINDRLIGEDSDDDNEDKERNDTSMNGSDDAFEDDVKVYNVVTQDRIDAMVSQYKRYKTQHSANPQNTGQRPSTDRPEANSTEAESNQFLLKDSQASKAISSDILKEAIDLSLALADDRFDRLVPVLLPSIQSLVIDCNNKELRTRISKWITRIARNVKN